MEDYDAIDKGLSRVEVALKSLQMAVERLRQGQNRLVCVTAVGFIITIAASAEMAVKSNALAVKMDGLPGEFKRLNETLSASLTAAGNNAPSQVIVIYAPTTPAK